MQPGHSYQCQQEDVTAAFEELKDSDEELTGFNAQLEAESGGSGSGSGGSSLVGSSLVKNSDEGTHRLPPVASASIDGAECSSRSIEAESRDGSGSGSSGGSFGWLWCSGSLLVAAAVCFWIGFPPLHSNSWWLFWLLGGLLVAAAVLAAVCFLVIWLKK